MIFNRFFMIFTVALTFISVAAFSPRALPRHRTQKLKLHPDQASELEAAACEILKVTRDVAGDRLDVDGLDLDDTKDDEMIASLSAAAATSSSQLNSNSKRWYSQAFVKFVSRGK